MDVEQAYDNLKASLLQKNGIVIAEEPFAHISVTQGSLWGLSSRTAKKTITYQLSSSASGTRITVSSSLAADWKNLTIIGSILSLVVASLCWWISIDLETFITTRQASWWSWLVTSGNFTYANLAWSFINLTRGLTVFLSVVVLLEVVIYVYARRGIDTFAEETLKTLA